MLCKIGIVQMLHIIANLLVKILFDEHGVLMFVIRSPISNISDRRNHGENRKFFRLSC